MEQLLPLAATAGTYRRYSISQEELIEPHEQTGVKDFFYVGKNIRRIDHLVNLFDGGFASDNIQKAICILKRIEQHQQPIPLVVIIDCTISLSAVEELSTYLNDMERFKTVPVIMDVCKAASDYGNSSQLMKIYDDVVDLKKIDNKFLERLAFLEKIKTRRIEIENKKRKFFSEESNSPGMNLFKRVPDILISSIIIFLTSPLLLLIAVAIKLESHGPVLYISRRTDKKYRIFNFWKFRTMASCAEFQLDQVKQLELFNEDKYKVFFKKLNEPQITLTGSLLRKSGFDKLPQFFNILLGDISIFDPRPIPLYEAAKQTPSEQGRFLAPCGVGMDIHRQNFLYDLYLIANSPSRP